MNPALVEWQTALGLLAAPLYFLVALVLYLRGLWKHYRFFFVYLLIEGIAAMATLLAGPENLRATIRIYMTVQPLLWAAFVLMVIEVFGKVLASYKGIARFSQRFVLVSLVVALAISFAFIGADTGTGGFARSSLFYYSVVQRAISGALSLHLLLVAMFLAWMPVPLPRNTVTHSFLFFFYFLATATVHLYLNRVGPAVVAQVNLAITGFTTAMLFAWIFLLRKDGEAVPAGPKPGSADPSAMIAQLEALNQSLVRNKR